MATRQGAEKIFPFDLLPRIIPAKEWEYLERGLAQRITALNLFLHDIYHEQKIVKDGVIPPFYVLSGKHFRREFVNFEVPKDIYIHVCGTDLIRETRTAIIWCWKTTAAARPASATCWKTAAR